MPAFFLSDLWSLSLALAGASIFLRNGWRRWKIISEPRAMSAKDLPLSKPVRQPMASLSRSDNGKSLNCVTAVDSFKIARKAALTASIPN